MEAAAGRIRSSGHHPIAKNRPGESRGTPPQPSVYPLGRLSKMGRRLTSGETPDYGSILDRISQAVLERVRRKNS